MRVEGPMKGELSFGIIPAKGGSAVSIRNKSSAGFWLPGMEWFLCRSVRADLRRLEIIIEGDE